MTKDGKLTHAWWKDDRSRQFFSGALTAAFFMIGAGATQAAPRRSPTSW